MCSKEIMSFEKKLQQLQQRPIRERRTVALLAAIVIFVPFMAVLSYAGAFALSPRQGGQGPLRAIGEQAGSYMNEIGGEIGNMTASTTAIVNDLKERASSTEAVSATSTDTATSTGGETSTSSAEEADLGEDGANDGVSGAGESTLPVDIPDYS